MGFLNVWIVYLNFDMWCCLLVSSSPEPSTGDDLSSEEDELSEESEDFEDFGNDQGGNKISVTFFSFFSTKFTKNCRHVASCNDSF